MKIPFKFNGSGSEYFKIWIVNILFTILTLGIYSAWAKVRTKRYFYSKTLIDNSSFEYHATPIQILKSRIIALVLIIIYGFVSSNPDNYIITLLMAASFYLSLPFLISKAIIFNARNSSWRNIRFGFNTDSLGEAYKVYLLLPILIPFTLSLIVPYISYKGWKFYISNAKFGKSHFEFDTAKISSFYKIYFICLFFIVLLIFVLGGTAYLGFKNEDIFIMTFVQIIPLFFTIVFIIIFNSYRVLVRNIALNNMVISKHTFESTVKLPSFFKIYFTNFFLIIITLGLFLPWAKVRMTKYFASNLFLLPEGDLNSFVQSEIKKVGAFGEEFTDISDVDIGGL
jgi:uncharacterized membrane protein YjgN (DUF898 family)